MLTNYSIGISTRSSARVPTLEQRRPGLKKSPKKSLQEVRCQNEPESGDSNDSTDSTDSLMNELKASVRKPRRSKEEEVDDCEDSNHDAVRRPRRGQRSLRRLNSLSVTESHDSVQAENNTNRDELQDDGRRSV